jgi:hypothetical protein
MIFEMGRMYGPTTYGGTYDGHYMVGITFGGSLDIGAADSTGRFLHQASSGGWTDEFGSVNNGTDAYFQHIMSHYYPSMEQPDDSEIPLLVVGGTNTGMFTRFDRRTMTLVSRRATGINQPKGACVVGDSYWIGSYAYEIQKHNLYTNALEDTIDIRNYPGLAISNAQIFADCTSDGTYLYTINYAWPFAIKWRLSDKQPVAWHGTGAYYDMPYHIDGGYYNNWGGATGTAGFAFCGGIITDGEYVWVADLANNSIKKLQCSDMTQVGSRWGKNYNGDHGKYFGFSGTEDGEYNSPWQLTSTRPGAQGDLIISDYGNNRIQTITKDGQFVSKIGSQGSGTDQFYVASAIASDGTHYYVYDSYNLRVHKRLIADHSLVAMFTKCTAGIYGAAYDIGYIDQQGQTIFTMEDSQDPFPTKGRGYIIG